MTMNTVIVTIVETGAVTAAISARRHHERSTHPIARICHLRLGSGI